MRTRFSSVVLLLLLVGSAVYADNLVIEPNPARPGEPILFRVTVGGGCPWAGQPVFDGTVITIETSPGGCIGPPEEVVFEIPLGGLSEGVYRVDLVFSGSSEAYLSEILVVQSTLTCFESENVLCLLAGRFQVEIDFAFQGEIRPAHVAPPRTDETGIFWFFSKNNWEAVVKVLDGCNKNGHFWVYAATATSNDYTLRVTDIDDPSEVRTYRHPAGSPTLAITDTSAFDCASDD